MENQRIRLSKTMLKQGLLTLLKEKPLQKITISEICETAQINRTTFYKYYGSQQDLLNEIESDFLRDLEEGLKPIAVQNRDALLSALTILYDHREIFKTLVSASSQKTLGEHVFALPVISMIFANLLKNHSFAEQELPYIQQFIFHGVFALIANWLCSENPAPVTDIAAILMKIRNRLYDGKVVFSDEIPQ